MGAVCRRRVTATDGAAPPNRPHAPAAVVPPGPND